jgi:hypothetical protein
MNRLLTVGCAIALGCGGGGNPPLAPDAESDGVVGGDGSVDSGDVRDDRPGDGSPSDGSTGRGDTSTCEPGLGGD